MQRLQATIESAAAFSSALAGSGWVADFRQLDRGREDILVDAVMGGGLMAMRVQLHNRIHQQILPPGGSVTFGVPTGPQLAGRLGRRVLESESVTCFDPRKGMDVVSATGFSAYTVSICGQRLSALLDAYGLPDPGQDSAWHGRQVYPEARALRTVRGLLQSFYQGLAGFSDEQLRNALSSLGSELALELVQAFSAGTPAPYVAASNRSRALKCAIAYVQEHPGEALTVEGLCQASAASISTLERAFREQFGVSPKQYLTAYRLHSVRRALLANSSGRKVGDVASDWGFWHLSKFAADYKRMFGELPSQTRAA